MSELHQAAQAALEALEELVEQAPFARYLKLTNDLRTALAFHKYSDALEKHRQITHIEGCWSWGPQHYMCCYNEVAKLRRWNLSSDNNSTKFRTDGSD
jgi:hypothetical protein